MKCVGCRRTMLAVDDDLAREAQRLGHHETLEDAVATALREYVQIDRSKETVAARILELEGTATYCDDFEHAELTERP